MLLILAPWRIVYIIRRWPYSVTAADRRRTILKHALMGPFDWIFIVVVLLLLCCIWRLPTLLYHGRLKTRLPRVAKHMLLGVLIDILAVLCLIFTVLTLNVFNFWRTFRAAYKIHKQRNSILSYVMVFVVVLMCRLKSQLEIFTAKRDAIRSKLNTLEVRMEGAKFKNEHSITSGTPSHITDARIRKSAMFRSRLETKIASVCYVDVDIMVSLMLKLTWFRLRSHRHQISTDSALKSTPCTRMGLC